METKTQDQPAAVESPEAKGVSAATTGSESYSSEQVNRLVSCVIFALKYMNCKGAGAMMKRKPDGGFLVVSWQDDFCEALAGIGLTVDKDALDKIRNPKRKRTPND